MTSIWIYYYFAVQLFKNMFALYTLHLDSQIWRFPSFTTHCMKDQVVQKYDQHPTILKVSQPYFLEVSEVEFKDKNSHV